ncbi:MAG: hypothetical protein GF398_05750 [Chitinivibrionales bacterium]|nr:hypothetical protein [Chitinivibrionales bacterium]
MRIPHLSASGIIFMLITGAYAQNARLDALANNFIIGDIGVLIGYPASAMPYTDVIQATAYENGSFGPLFAIKSIGEWGALGVIANQESYLRNNFYTDSKKYLSGSIGQMNGLPDEIPPFPHLLFAAEAGPVTFGLDLFYTIAKVNTTPGNEHEGSIRNAGALFNVDFLLGNFGVYPFAGFSIPNTEGKLATDNEQNDITVATEKANMINAGLDVGFTISYTDFTLGGVFTSEKYQFSNTRNDTKTTSPEQGLQDITLYAGAESWPEGNIMFSLVYTYDLLNFEKVDRIETSSDTLDQRADSTVQTNSFILSGEYYLPVDRIVDNLVFRGGLYWEVADMKNEITTDTLSAGGSSKTAFEGPHQVSDVVPTIGLGLTRGWFTFDIATRLAGWEGAISGPPIVTGSLTINFGGRDE